MDGWMNQWMDREIYTLTDLLNGKLDKLKNWEMYKWEYSEVTQGNIIWQTQAQEAW